MAEYTKDKHFSFGWVIGGAVLMLIALWFGRFVLTGLATHDMWVDRGVEAGCFALGGFVIGWQSEGSTIIEAGIAALLALVGAIYLFFGGIIFYDPVSIGEDYAIPLVASVVGAWLGEKFQGDVIVTKDD
ncbi:MAG TPA: hypothetical protein VMJ10_22995 [Kofleriaceae bacterium]|nr:hypothetical protein [Kofleriaceae bacterium]